MQRLLSAVTIVLFGACIACADTPATDLANYWDSIAAGGSKADYERYMELAAAIQSGRPGLGEYDGSELHDSWIALLEDFERYWSEHCPRTFHVEVLKKYLSYTVEPDESVRNEDGSAGFTYRDTVNYFTSITPDFSLKYCEIRDVVLAGLRRARRPEWADIPYRWPLESVHTASDGAEEGGSLLLHSKKNNLASLAYINKTSFFDVALDVVDSGGRTIASGQGCLAGTAQLLFEDVSEEASRVIDSGEISFKIRGLALVYGNPPFIMASSRSWLSSLQQKNLDAANVRLTSAYQKSPQERNPVLETAARVIAEEIMVPVGGGGSVSSFSMSKTEVTQLLYRAVMNANPSGFKGDDRPVETVSWFDALVFCNRLSKITGKSPVYNVDGSSDTEDWNYAPHRGASIYGEISVNSGADGFRLPSEEEWLFAARGGSQPEDYEFSGSNEIKDVAWYKDGIAAKGTHVVAQKQANSLGLYDMTGNVWEWCWDSPHELIMIAHGGSYSYKERDCKIDDLYYRSPNMRFDCLGIRLASGGTVRPREESFARAEESLSEEAAAEYPE